MSQENISFDIFPREEYKNVLGLVMALGGSKSGKTTWIQDFLDATKDEWWYTYVAATANESNRELSDRFPPSAIHGEPDWEKIKLIHEVAEIRASKRRTNTEHYAWLRDTYQIPQYEYERLVAEEAKGQKILIYLEDCAMDRAEFASNKVLMKLVSKGRHADICLIISAQDTKALPPKMRRQTKFAVACRATDEEAIEDLRKCYFSVLPKAVFDRAFPILTSNYQCMIADRRDVVDSTDMTAAVFTYRASWPIPRSQVGSLDQWTTDAFVYDEQWREREMEIKESRVYKHLTGGITQSVSGPAARKRFSEMNIVHGYMLGHEPAQPQVSMQQQQQQQSRQTSPEEQSRQIAQWLEQVNAIARQTGAAPLSWNEGVAFLQQVNIAGGISNPFQFRTGSSSVGSGGSMYAPQPQSYYPQSQQQSYQAQPQVYQVQSQPQDELGMWLTQYNQYAQATGQPLLTRESALRYQQSVYTTQPRQMVPQQQQMLRSY